MAEENVMSMTGDEQADLLLRKLMHLKRYEVAEDHRMIRNKQNIMRQVRESTRTKRKSLVDRLEIKIPWFFAEPKYGLAFLFVAFVGLQYLGINTRNATLSQTGIYTDSYSIAALEQSSMLSTNQISYPKLPSNMSLFPEERTAADVKFVGFVEK